MKTIIATIALTLTTSAFASDKTPFLYHKNEAGSMSLVFTASKSCFDAYGTRVLHGIGITASTGEVIDFCWEPLDSGWKRVVIYSLDDRKRYVKDVSLFIPVGFDK